MAQIFGVALADSQQRPDNAVVLPNGELLAHNGLDRERGAVFKIDPDLLKYVPKQGDCTPDAVAKAYKFLADEWLVDVDAEAKARLF